MILGATGSTNSGSGFNAIDYSHIAGLASGIDTDSMVKAMMQAESIPLNRLMQQKQLWQWKQDDYRQVNSALLDFRTNELFSMKLQSTFLAKTVSSSDTSVVTATAAATSPAASYSVSVSQLAQGVTVASATALTAAGQPQLDPNAPLNQLSTATGWSPGAGPHQVTINGETVTFDPATDTLNTLLAKISSDPKTGVTAFYDAVQDKVVFQTTATGSGAKITVSGDNDNLFAGLFHLNPAGNVASVNAIGTLTKDASLRINGVSFNFSAGQTLSDIVTAINGQTAVTGVQAQDDGSGHLKLVPVNGGAAGPTLYSPISVEVVSDPGNAFGGFQGVSANAAKDAIYTVNGYTSYSATNTVVYNGVTMTLKGVSAKDANGNPVSSSLVVTTDVDTVVKAIEGFVDKYNSLMKTMNDLYHEKRNYDYPPLTDDQKSQMTQDQITKWETMAKSGMLSSDPLLGNVIDSLRGIAGSVLQGQAPSTVNGQTVTLNSLASIGITTGDWWEYGQLHVNEDQLRAAVQADPQAVMRLFTNPTSSVTDTSSPGAGIAAKLYNAVNTAIDQISQEAGSASDLVDNSWIGQQVREIDTQAAEMQQQLDQKRQYYYQQFTAMEQALSQLNSQAGFFQSMMAGH
ncbi:flagellar filament capping protein FliD [Kyrpidia sp.]|uniref:flagellar filament capping protein FliD n=1 Tax=Kyrpidia sp. TaxID=2073077 RepID=UPI00258EE748|nr:flagellar filament capping protein FliD [Kyrpidia sp.]MCL6576176.1 flagellar filament capping protein FliD [Kyrpidia sp.]